MADETGKVRQVIADWLDATAKGDLDRVLALMTDDMEFITAGGPPFGKKQFAENSRGMKIAAFSGRPDIREVECAGDWAYVRQDLTVEITPEGGAPMRLRGANSLDFSQRRRRRMAPSPRRQFRCAGNNAGVTISHARIDLGHGFPCGPGGVKDRPNPTANRSAP